ncbi:hypothetical protein Trydic_g20683 [Trypoxylus dichotomus]
MHRRFLRCPVHHEHPFLFGSANVAATGRANGRERSHPKRRPIPTRTLGIRVAQGRESEQCAERNESPSVCIETSRGRYTVRDDIDVVLKR